MSEPRIITPLHAIRALRWNYRWRGVWVWLRARSLSIPGHPERPGWWLVLAHPRRVWSYQMAIAEGVTS